MKEIDNDYKLIPMNEITDEARILAVRWGDNMKDDFITQKHKLASDIMNYARRYHENELKKLRVADVSGMLKSFVKYAKNRSISDINIDDDTIDYFIEDFNLR